MMDGKRYDGSLLIYRSDRTAFWSEIDISHAENPWGEGPILVCKLRDISDRINLEARLGSAQRLEAIGRLSGGFAHDFNNLLALILGNAELILARTTPGTPDEEAARDIVEAASSGAELIRRMLGHARGKGAGQSGFPLDEAIGEILDLVRHGIAETTKIEIEAGAAEAVVLVDRALFDSALINLLINARDAMENRKGRIRVHSHLRAAKTPLGGFFAEVSVIDDGPGMTRELAARALEPFFTTKPAGKGNGLGLAMVESFARQYGGNFIIDSTPGRGTKVTMLLPAMTAKTARGTYPDRV